MCFGDVVFKDGFWSMLCVNFLSGCAGTIVCWTSAVYMHWLVWAAIVSMQVLTYRHPKLSKAVVLLFRLIVFWPLWDAVLSHSQCCNTQTHDEDWRCFRNFVRLLERDCNVVEWNFTQICCCKLSERLRSLDVGRCVQSSGYGSYSAGNDGDCRASVFDWRERGRGGRDQRAV